MFEDGFLCFVRHIRYVEYCMCEKLFGSLLSKGLSQSALCDVEMWNSILCRLCHEVERLEGADLLKHEY